MVGTREPDPRAARGWERASSFRREPDKRVTVYYHINGSVPKESLAFGSSAGVLTAAQRAPRKRSGAVTATPGRSGLGQRRSLGGPGDGLLSGAAGPNCSCGVRVVGALRCPVAGRWEDQPASWDRVKVGGDPELGWAEGERVLRLWRNQHVASEYWREYWLFPEHLLCLSPCSKCWGSHCVPDNGPALPELIF